MSIDRTSAALHDLWSRVDVAVARTAEYGVPAGLEAEGARYATDLLRLALLLHVHDQDPDRPRLVEMIGPTLRWGWDNPYTTYHYAPLSGDSTYRIVGRRNSSVYLGVTAYGGGAERAGTMPTSVIGSINDTTIPVTPDGRYAITLSPEPAPDDGSAWLRLDPDVSSVIVRQYVRDPDDEVFATARIERVPAAGPPTPLTPDRFESQVQAARAYFDAMWTLSDQIVSNLSGRARNEFNPPLQGGLDPAGRPSGYMYPTVDNLYTFGWYELADDEALVVRVTPPSCRYWSFYLGSVFQQSLPYDVGYGLITRETATFAADGSVRFVISAHDPGLPNWLGTQGHPLGMMAVRWLLPDTDEAPLPTCEVLPTRDLR